MIELPHRRNLVEYLRSQTTPPNCTKSRRAYIKRVASGMFIDDKEGHIMKKIDGGEKVVITTMQEYEDAVTDSLSNGSPLSARGINVRDFMFLVNP